MKTSPVQLKRLSFERVCVEVDKRHVPASAGDNLEPVSLFGVALNTVVEFVRLDGIAEDSATETFRVGVELTVDNESGEEGVPPKYSPYLIRMSAVGIVEVPRAASQLAPIEDLALVNGASLVWSSMREQLATVTGRMPLGSVQLPSVHFQDLRSEGKKPTVPLPPPGSESAPKRKLQKKPAAKK